GIGVMGLADMFIKLGITYGNFESNVLISIIMDVMSNTILQSNALLAKERGVYPEYSSEVLNTTYLESVANDITMEMIGKYGLRNSQLLSVAPTGSISTMLGVSGGVEPIFAISHNRKSESLGDGEDVVYKVYAQIVQDYMEVSGITKEDELPEYFVTSHDIHYEDRIEFQGTIQTYVDNAISSTVNLPNSATVEDIEKVYQLAWMYGLKGVTVYRDGCMREGILTTDEPKKVTGKEIKVEESELDSDCST
ncbi:MAG TPA: ribonucleoside-diphosphate reductase, adenosylcobalamin-dependent, partial [Tissierellaceae bacterium]|nr:ribonucleoside-diphosphate reductase, adenosylcobalamin-dependent [Tissierellaceae bacterium]